ncbi:MAG: GNAT family N-acetyltransferase, partial [Patescibacteria group bacterium]|nr:GNAT family N-acetyltransferase [Patescibacteria group bacterium]
MLKVSEIRQFDDLHQLRSAWSELLRQTAGASFFQSFEWLETYMRHFGDGMSLHVLVMGDPRHPDGILPLVAYPEKTRIGCLRVLSYPLHDWGSFYGPIGPDPEGTLRAGIGHLRRSSRDWDFLELRWCGAPGTDLRHYDAAMQAAGLQSHATIWDRTAVVDLRGDWATYFAGRPSSLRNNFRRRQKHLAAIGELRFERYRPRGEAAGDAEPRWDLYEGCEQLAGRSWQARACDGTTLSSESIRPFLREVHAAAVRLGAVDVNLLRLDGRPVA